MRTQNREQPCSRGFALAAEEQINLSPAGSLLRRMGEPKGCRLTQYRDSYDRDNVSPDFTTVPRGGPCPEVAVQGRGEESSPLLPEKRQEFNPAR